MKFVAAYNLVGFLIIIAGAGITIKAGKLTYYGALTGACIASLIYAASGYTGLAMLGGFFLMGTLATSWKRQQKQLTPILIAGDQLRDAGQVAANAGVPALAGLFSILYPEYNMFLHLIMAASLASAAADTLSSELGMIYGRKFYNIITLKHELKGLDGVISIEGTLAGIAGAAVIALIYAIGHNRYHEIGIIILAGTAGSLIDSVLGALLERRKLLSNNMVNFLNTAAAALIAGILAALFKVQL